MIAHQVARVACGEGDQHAVRDYAVIKVRADAAQTTGGRGRSPRVVDDIHSLGHGPVGCGLEIRGRIVGGIGRIEGSTAGNAQVETVG